MSLSVISTIVDRLLTPMQMLQSERTQSMRSLQKSMGQLVQENSELKRKLSKVNAVKLSTKSQVCILKTPCCQPPPPTPPPPVHIALAQDFELETTGRFWSHLHPFLCLPARACLFLTALSVLASPTSILGKA